MAARKGPRGTTTTITQDQLQAMGCAGKEMPSVQAAPPPLFPPLLSKPVTLESNPDRDYKILWKEDFISFLRESAYYTSPLKSADAKVQRYSDKYINVIENDAKVKKVGEFYWSLMPSELRPNWKRAKHGPESALKKQKVVDIEGTLKNLEQKEKEGVKTIKNEAESDAEEENEINEDDEMDEDIDYGNNYFDNGEAFNEEDDNLDDGPVY